MVSRGDTHPNVRRVDDQLIYAVHSMFIAPLLNQGIHRRTRGCAAMQERHATTRERYAATQEKHAAKSDATPLNIENTTECLDSVRQMYYA